MGIKKKTPTFKFVRVYPVAAGKKPIFVVACYRPSDGIRRSYTRTWGWFSTKKEAMRAVEVDHTGMFEIGYYTHAVIESFLPGIFPYGKQVAWYNYNPKTKKAKLVPAPKFAKNVVNFGMG